MVQSNVAKALLTFFRIQKKFVVGSEISAFRLCAITATYAFIGIFVNFKDALGTKFRNLSKN